MLLAEEALQLHVRNLRRLGKWHRSGRIDWSDGTSADFRVVEYSHEAEVLLDYTVNSVPVHQKIECESTEQRIGRRWWFVCPKCGRRMGVLYMPRGQTEFRCRDCHNLRYRWQAKDLDKVLKPLMLATGRSRKWARETLDEMNRALSAGARRPGRRRRPAGR